MAPAHQVRMAVRNILIIARFKPRAVRVDRRLVVCTSAMKMPPRFRLRGFNQLLNDAPVEVQVLQHPRVKSVTYCFVRTFHILESAIPNRREPRRGATCEMRLPVKLQQVKLRARPPSSVSFRSGDPC